MPTRGKNGLASLILCSASFLAFLLPGPAARASGQPSVVHHDLSVRLHPERHSLAGMDTLTVRTGGEQTLSFTLSATAEVEKVTAGGKEIPFTFAGGSLRVVLAPETAGRGKLSLAVKYRASFRDRVPEGPVDTGDPGYGVRGTIRERGTFLGGDAGWYPDLPGSRATFRVLVEAPPGYESVTAGRRIRRGTSGGVTRSEWETRESPGGLSLSAGPYRVREKRSGGIVLSTYFYPETYALSEPYLRAVERFLDLYRGLLGPYPFEKFAVVENFFPTGYGFPSYTLLGSTVVRLPFIVETSLGHEVAHSWFGNGVRADYDRGNWSEGLTTYVADYLYKERSSAEEGREYRLKILRDYSTLVPRGGGFPLASFSGRDSPASQAIGYGKGAMVFHMARRLAGDDAFWNGLRDVVREKMFREATWGDFAQAIGRESGIDLSPFFRQWVERGGAPVIALSGVTAERDGKGWRVSGRVVQEKPYFDLRVPMRLVTEGGKIDTVLDLSGGEAPFSFSAEANPRTLLLDPETDLFRRLDPSEIPPTVNAIRGSTDLLVVAARGVPDDIRDSSNLLLAGLGKEQTAILREEETPPSRLAGHDVLFLGIPKGNGYLPPLPEELSLSPTRFALGGERFDSPGDSLFVVLPHPAGGGRVTALFLPFSAEAASLAARKIPHYGKYSYLAFSEGKNRAKGTWPPLSSPATHEFPGGTASP
ncbi:MAG: M1 family peptidase [Deltaproteobacteria bacterium]|nr:MAG: M1 family peptidase [Deltaproteobacteria bacterium]